MAKSEGKRYWSSAKIKAKIEFRLQDYEGLFYILQDTDSALVAIIPALANKGLIEVELENARREIVKIRLDEEKERLTIA